MRSFITLASASDEVLLAAVVTGEGVRPHYGPVDIVSYLFEEGSAVAVFKSLEDFANTVGRDGHLDISFFCGLNWP